MGPPSTLSCGAAEWTFEIPVVNRDRCFFANLVRASVRSEKRSWCEITMKYTSIVLNNSIVTEDDEPKCLGLIVVESSIGLAGDPMPEGWAFSRGEDVSYNAGGNLISAPGIVEQGETSIAVRWGNPRLQYNQTNLSFGTIKDDVRFNAFPQESQSPPLLTSAEGYLAAISEPALITLRGTGHSAMFVGTVFSGMFLIREATPKNIAIPIGRTGTQYIISVFEDDCFAIGFNYDGEEYYSADNLLRTATEKVPPRVYPTFTPVLDLLTWKVRRDDAGEPLLSRVVPFETGSIPGGGARRDIVVTFRVATEKGETEPPANFSLDLTIRVNRR